jgi:membrane-associated phospholipid phosphatase
MGGSMLEFLNSNPDWILEYRTESLTTFFTLFPKIFNEYFYLFSVAIGYWLNPQKKLFPALGFLVSFGQFINCFLKNSFRINRPDAHLHLVTINDFFGFPSGDTQMATVFWLTLFLYLSRSSWRYVCLMPLMAVGVSRVYLGVHTVVDVMGGFATGVFLVLVFYPQIINSFKIIQGRWIHREFFLFMIGVCLYAFVSQGLEWPPISLISLGLMMGCIFSLPWLREKHPKIDLPSFPNNIVYLILRLIVLIGIVKFMPIIKTDPVYLYATTLLKYAITIFSIFVFIPRLIKKPYSV